MLGSSEATLKPSTRHHNNESSTMSWMLVMECCLGSHPDLTGGGMWRKCTIRLSGRSCTVASWVQSYIVLGGPNLSQPVSICFIHSKQVTGPTQDLLMPAVAVRWQWIIQLREWMTTVVTPGFGVCVGVISDFEFAKLHELKWTTSVLSFRANSARKFCDYHVCSWDSVSIPLCVI